MIQFRFGMPLWLMSIYGGVMIMVVLAIRLTLGRRLPKRMMPVLWALVLVRLLVPFSVSSPLSLPVPSFLEEAGSTWWSEEEATAIYKGPLVAAVSDVTVTSSSGDIDFGIIPKEDQECTSVLQVAQVQEDLRSDVWAHIGNAPSLMGQLGMGFGGIGLAGMVVVALAFFYRYIWGRNHFNGLYPIEENDTVRQTLIACRVNAGVHSCDTIQSPVVVGILRPVILLPASLDFGDRGLLRHILTHEAMHIRRRDNLVKLIMIGVLCLHWYNPLVWLMARELCRDMEAACDEAALSLLGQEESAPYAQSLLRMAVPGLSGGLFASAFSRTEVERRVRGVLSYRRLGALTLTAAAVVVLTSATAFATCGQTFFYNYLSDWCYSGNTYVARAVLNRPIDLGGSRDYARSRSNAVIMEMLRYSAPDDIRVKSLEKELQKRLAREFGVEPGAFRVLVGPALDPEQTAAQYKEYGLEKDKDGRWQINGKPVHVLEDQMAGSYYSYEGGEVDVYVIRDEQYKLLQIESYQYYRF